MCNQTKAFYNPVKLIFKSCHLNFGCRAIQTSSNILTLANKQSSECITKTWIYRIILYDKDSQFLIQPSQLNRELWEESDIC